MRIAQNGILGRSHGWLPRWLYVPDSAPEAAPEAAPTTRPEPDAPRQAGLDPQLVTVQSGAWVDDLTTLMCAQVNRLAGCMHVAYWLHARRA